MKTTSFCVRRSITTLMFFLGILLLGAISWYFLPQELFPPLTYPVITVLTTYEGASPYEIESLITRPIEEVVGTINRVKSISSISKEGTSIVMVEFDWGTNMDFASLEVREKIDLKKASLPREAKEPLVMKYNPFQTPTMRINLTGDISPLKLRKLTEKTLKEDLEKIEGVGCIEVVGGAKREILVEVDEARLRAASLSILDIYNSLKNANLNYPAGRIEKAFFEFLLRTIGEFKTVKEIEKLPIKAEYPISEIRQLVLEKEGEKETTAPETERLVFLKDVANVKDTTKEKESISRYQGKECVTLLVRKQSQANTVKLSKKIREKLKKIKKLLPQGVNVKIVYDEAEFIKKALSSVKNAALSGGILAFLVILFFLRNLWFSTAIIISIPLCILTVFILMYLSKMSLNIISLGGLALGVGMMVDNAIVVLESIFVNPLSDLRKRIVEGTKEVGAAIVGSTLTTICVFLPMIFVVGIAGQLFKQLSFAVIFSLLASLMTAITLLPTLIFIKKAIPPQRKEISLNFWQKIFSFFFKHKIIVLISVFALFLVSIKIFMNLDKEFLPKADYHAFTIKVDAPAGTPLEETDRICREIEVKILKIPEIEEVSVNIGSSSEKPEEKAIQSQGLNQAQIFVKLNPRVSTKKLIKELREKLKYLKDKGITLNFLAQESFLKEIFAQEAPFILEIKGAKIDKLKKIGKILYEKLEKLPFLYNLKLDIPPSRPEIKTEVLKDKALLYSINTQIIADTLETSIKGRVPTRFKEKGEEYDIRVRLRKEDRDDIEKLKRLLIHGIFQDKKINVPLMEVANIKKGLGPIEIKRKNAQRCILLSASIYKKPLSKVIEEVNKIIQKIKLPKGYEISISGEGKKMAESFNSLRFALLLSLILVFMLLASEFESLWQPFIIFITVPLSLIGVSSILFFTHTPLNVVSFLGLIMLGGIVVNNGIVLVDYINFLRREKKIKDLIEVLKIASTRRIRPILMTSLTTILGLLPLSLGIGEAQLMQSLGIVTIGGLLSSTFLTPVVLPIIYYYFEKAFAFLRKSKTSEKGKIISETEKVSQEKKETKSLLNSRQQKLLVYLKEHKKITRAQYIKAFNVSTSTAARDLKKLLDLGLIEAKGPLGPGREYYLKEKNEPS